METSKQMVNVVKFLTLFDRLSKNGKIHNTVSIIGTPIEQSGALSYQIEVGMTHHNFLLVAKMMRVVNRAIILTGGAQIDENSPMSTITCSSGSNGTLYSGKSQYVYS